MGNSLKLSFPKNFWRRDHFYKCRDPVTFYHSLFEMKVQKENLYQQLKEMRKRSKVVREQWMVGQISWLHNWRRVEWCIISFLLKPFFYRHFLIAPSSASHFGNLTLSSAWIPFQVPPAWPYLIWLISATLRFNACILSVTQIHMPSMPCNRMYSFWAPPIWPSQIWISIVWNWSSFLDLQSLGTSWGTRIPLIPKFKSLSLASQS